MVFGEPATAYVLNLAVVGSERHLAGSLRLFADLRARARRFSIRRLYFHSRVIGFAGWLADEFPDADPTALPPAERLRLAQRYSKSTMPNDNTRPLDRLLRMYVDRGCQVLGVTSGWSLDRLSLGYGVLCRRDLPPQPRSAPA